MSSESKEVEGVAPATVGMISCEVVLSQADFFVSVNGMNPSECDCYTVSSAGCIVFHCGSAELVTVPLPPMLLELVAVAPQILFVRFVDGTPEDAKVLKHRDSEVRDGYRH